MPPAKLSSSLPSWELGSRVKVGQLPKKGSPCPSPQGWQGRNKGHRGSCPLGHRGQRPERAPTAGALDGPLAPCGHTALPVWGVEARQPSQGAGGCSSNLAVLKPHRHQSLCDTWQQASLLKAFAPLGPMGHRAFQKMQTPGQGRAEPGAQEEFPCTAAGCTTGQVPTCPSRVARTRRPSRGTLWGRGAGVHGSPAAGHSAPPTEDALNYPSPPLGAYCPPNSGPVPLPPHSTEEVKPQGANTNQH